MDENFFHLMRMRIKWLWFTNILVFVYMKRQYIQRFNSLFYFVVGVLDHSDCDHSDFCAKRRHSVSNVHIQRTTLRRNIRIFIISQQATTENIIWNILFGIEERCIAHTSLWVENLEHMEDICLFSIFSEEI